MTAEKRVSWQRIGAAVGLLVLIAAAALWLRQATAPALSMASSLAGSRWYRVELGNARIGSYQTSIARLRGRVHFASQLDATLPGGEPFRVTEQLEFEAAAPQALLRGAYTSGNGARRRAVKILRDGTRYQASIDTGGVREQRVLNFQYTLTDHLALELWLRQDRPPAGAERRVPSLDFERLEPLARRYRVIERRDDGYALASAAPLDDQIVLFDAELVPRALSLAGLFTLTRAPATTRDEPNRSGRRSQIDYARVALSRQIPRPTDVRRLTLAVNRAATALSSRPGLTLAAEGGGWLLVSEPARAAPTPPDRSDGSAAVALGLPDDDPRLRELLAHAPRGTGDPLAALTNFVHGYLQYDDASHSLGLADTLHSRRGDCTEFADLLTALARAAGYRARTVTGLVYTDDGGPAFMLHAWSEVLLDNHWRGLDPTWNEARLDATHLPLPDSDVGYLRAYAALPDMHFEVRSVDYY
jgi:transglutaminase-like putative cysteine protease